MNADEEIVAAALEYGSKYIAAGEFWLDARAALNRLTSRCIPTLPEGWIINALGMDQVHKTDPYYWWVRLDCEPPGLVHEEQPYGEGPAIRAACEAAIARISEQKS